MLAADTVQQPAPTFRSNTRTVPLYVTVQDKAGRLVTGLDRDAFEVFDSGRPVAIAQFSSEPQPITMVLLVDMSGSMAFRHREARDAMLALVEELLPADRLRLGTFGDRILFTPWLTSDKEILRRLLHYELHPGTTSPLWEAMSTSILSLEDEPGRRVVLAVTDGRDSCAGRDCPTADSVSEHAVRKETLVYVIGLTGTQVHGDIKSLAARTGGGHYQLPAGADMAAAFRQIAAELHQQYLIGFTPPVIDGKRHTIDVRLKTKGLTARTRKDYYAS